MSKISDWLAQQARTDLDEHVRPEIQALAARGNVTPAETAELRCNSWEWEHLIPALTDEAFIERTEYTLKNCSVHKRPFLTYDEAAAGLYLPELLQRFKLLREVLEEVRHRIYSNDVPIDVYRALGRIDEALRRGDPR